MAENNNSSFITILTDDEKQILHTIALNAIKENLRIKGNECSQTMTDTLKQKTGAFVSLHKHGQLRGCIGYIQAVKPLSETIHDMAVAAAFQDPRFPPLREDELSDLDIEISVLTPMVKISDIREIEVGKHGLLIINGPCSGLLLPQVAIQYNWQRETFLSETCRKAGLPAGSWKDIETEIYVFSAEIF